VDPATLAEPVRSGLDAPPDWASLGLALTIVGCFLLATAVLSRSPRDLIEERFGRRPALRSIREPIAGRVQLLLGFAFLTAGFGLQLLAHLLAPGAAPPPGATPESGFPAFWIGLIVVCAAVLSMVAGWWSNVALRHHLRAYFREQPPDLETDMQLAREVGELFGIEPYEDDTVQAYVARLRREAGLPARRPEPRPEPLGSMEGDEDTLLARDLLALVQASRADPRNRA
jgi:hypothetical protein